MPVFLMWRLVSLSALAFAAGKLFEGPVHWSDQNIGHFLVLTTVVLFSFTIALAIVIRLAFSAIRKTLSIERLRGPQNRFMLFFDTAALIAVGCFVGLLVVISLSVGLSGTTPRINLDLAIAILASVVATIVLGRSRSKVAITITAIFATLALSALIGSRQANNILTTAERLADGRAWCLTTARDFGPISDRYQLGFFALPKEFRLLHVGLMIRESDGTAFSAYWSIRQQTFHRSSNRYRGPTSTCHPIENFAEALKNGSVEDGT